MLPEVNAVTTAVSQLPNLQDQVRGLNSTGAQNATIPFSNLITDAVSQVNTLENQAHAAVNGLMTGLGVDVHQAMIATQKAGMAFELALSVRNKAVQAYQSVMGMQF
jgi:flagellar hook-basal body complex protein FliE